MYKHNINNQKPNTSFYISHKKKIVDISCIDFILKGNFVVYSIQFGAIDF